MKYNKIHPFVVGSVDLTGHPPFVLVQTEVHRPLRNNKDNMMHKIEILIDAAHFAWLLGSPLASPPKKI